MPAGLPEKLPEVEIPYPQPDVATLARAWNSKQHQLAKEAMLGSSIALKDLPLRPHRLATVATFDGRYIRG